MADDADRILADDIKGSKHTISALFPECVRKSLARRFGCGNLHFIF